MGKTYDNEIIEAEVSLAIEQLLIADYPQEWDPCSGRIDVNTPPAGFTNLGAVVEDSPTITIRKEKYQLKLGLPKALQYEAIIGVDGELTISVYGKSNAIVSKALGVDVQECSTPGITRAPFGRTQLKKYALLGVADFLDGTQVVHYFPEVSAKTEYTENLRPDDAGKIALGFDAYSYISSAHGNERIVGERVYFEAES